MHIGLPRPALQGPAVWPSSPRLIGPGVRFRRVSISWLSGRLFGLHCFTQNEPSIRQSFIGCMLYEWRKILRSDGCLAIVVLRCDRSCLVRASPAAEKTMLPPHGTEALKRHAI
jgi:hypothetical protein